MNRNRLAFVFLSLGLLLLTGCATGEFGQSKLDDFGAYLALEKGKTTKTEVYETFGQPYKVTGNESGGTDWTFWAAKTTYGALTAVPIANLFVGGSNVYATIATFHFDADGVFVGTEREETAGYWNTLEGFGTVGQGEKYELVVEGVRIEMESLSLPFDSELAEALAVNADVIAELPPD